MTLINSLSVAFIMMTIVFIVLGVLFALLRLQTSILGSFKGSNGSKPANTTQVSEKVVAAPKQMEISTGELELIGVNEETAAMVMAMASYDLNIPLNELQFKSIKALD
jgi:hypothetical protein